MALVNASFFTAATEAVDSCNTCADLQRIVDQQFAGINPMLAQISTQIALLAPLLVVPSGNFTSIVTWITNYIAVLNGPSINLAAQLTELTTAIAGLTAAITAKAAELGGGCSITIPT